WRGGRRLMANAPLRTGKGRMVWPRLVAEWARGQWPDERAQRLWVLGAGAWDALAHQIRWRTRQIVHLQVDVGAEAVEERQLEVGRLAKRAVRADLHAVATEDAAVQRKVVAHQLTFRHHQRA